MIKQNHETGLRTGWLAGRPDYIYTPCRHIFSRQQSLNQLTLLHCVMFISLSNKERGEARVNYTRRWTEITPSGGRRL